MHTDEYCDTSSVELLYLEKEFSLWETDSIQRGRLSISAVGGAGLNRPVLERRCRIKKQKKNSFNRQKKQCVFAAEVEKICVAEFRHFKPKNGEQGNIFRQISQWNFFGWLLTWRQLFSITSSWISYV